MFEIQFYKYAIVIRLTLFIDWYLRFSINDFCILSLKVMQREVQAPWIVYILGIEMLWFGVEFSYSEELLRNRQTA